MKLTIKKYNKETYPVVSLRMPKELISKIDDVAQRTKRTRNDIIIKALDFAMNNIEIEGETID